MKSITLITCTGGRPEALALLARWIGEQTLVDFDWLVVDDCDPPSWETSTAWEVSPKHVILPYKKWRPGDPSSMTANLALALATVTTDKILFCEDDEIYLPDYVKTMSILLDTAPLVGEIPARYYHVGQRCYRVFPNQKHASLCQTGIRREMIPALLHLCEGSSQFIDMGLWRSPGTLVRTDNVVSIKGLPGRPGIGVGHRPPDKAHLASARIVGGWTADPNLDMLRHWVGDRANAYTQFER